MVQTSVRDFVANGRGGAPVKQVCGGCKGLSPVLGGHGRMDEHGAHRVIEGTKHTFSFAILWGSVGTGEMEDDAVGSKQVVHGMVNKLRPVISLEASNGRTELCATSGRKFIVSVTCSDQWTSFVFSAVKDHICIQLLGGTYTQWNPVPYFHEFGSVFITSTIMCLGSSA